MILGWRAESRCCAAPLLISLEESQPALSPPLKSAELTLVGFHLSDQHLVLCLLWIQKKLKGVMHTQEIYVVFLNSNEPEVRFCSFFESPEEVDQMLQKKICCDLLLDSRAHVSLSSDSK